MDFHTLKVSHIERLTETSVRVDLFPVRYGEVDWSFKAGQYLTLETEIDSEKVRRSYSLCSSPASHVLSVGIKEVPGGKFSTFANRRLQVGDTLQAMLPMGNFINKDEATAGKNFVFIAAGSGITPVLSMIKSTLESNSTTTATLFYGNKKVKSIMFLEEIEALKNLYIGRLRLFHILSRQPQDSDLFNGRIDGKKLISWNGRCVDCSESDGFFLCGPESMIMDVRDTLRDLSVSSDKVHFELFTSEAGESAREARKILQPDSGPSKAVDIILHGKKMPMKFTSDDDNILDKALGEGADLPFACKGGVCCTCKARLEEGTVEMYVNYGLEKDEMEAGFILTCQSYPTSDHVVVNFDNV